VTARTIPPITRHQYAGKHASGSGGQGARVRMRAGGCVLHRDQQVPGVLNANMAPGGVKAGCSNCGAMHTLRCCGAAAWITTWTPMPVGYIFLSFFLRCLLGSPTYLALVFSVHPFISFLYRTINSLPFFRCFCFPFFTSYTVLSPSSQFITPSPCVLLFFGPAYLPLFAIPIRFSTYEYFKLPERTDVLSCISVHR
jgi:hypothetical protein